MTQEELKKVNKMFYAVKGHLFPIEYSENEMRVVYESYFNRMWGNNEFYIHVEDFDAVWDSRTTWLPDEENMSKLFI